MLSIWGRTNTYFNIMICMFLLLFTISIATILTFFYLICLFELILNIHDMFQLWSIPLFKRRLKYRFGTMSNFSMGSILGKGFAQGHTDHSTNAVVNYYFHNI